MLTIEQLNPEELGRHATAVADSAEAGVRDWEDRMRSRVAERDRLLADHESARVDMGDMVGQLAKLALDQTADTAGRSSYTRAVANLVIGRRESSLAPEAGATRPPVGCSTIARIIIQDVKDDPAIDDALMVVDLREKLAGGGSDDAANPYGLRAILRIVEEVDGLPDGYYDLGGNGHGMLGYEDDLTESDEPADGQAQPEDPYRHVFEVPARVQLQNDHYVSGSERTRVEEDIANVVATSALLDRVMELNRAATAQSVPTRLAASTAAM